MLLSLKKIKSFLQNLVSINDWLRKYFQADRAEIVSYIILESKKEPHKALETTDFDIFITQRRELRQKETDGFISRY